MEGVSTRTAEVETPEGWQSKAFKELKPGEKFRLREETGELADEGEVCVCLSEPAIDPKTGVYFVDVNNKE